MGYKYNIEDIVATGSELIRKKGYHNIGINDILKASGIPKGSFYNFFKSKEDFAKKALERYGKRSLNMIKSFLENEKFTPLQRLKNFYAHLIDGNEMDGLDSGCLINNLSIELGAINQNLGNEANKYFVKWVEAIGKCVEEGQEKGEITANFPADYIAEYLHSGLYGAFSRMKVNHNRVYLDKWYEMTFEFIIAK